MHVTGHGVSTLEIKNSLSALGVCCHYVAIWTANPLGEVLSHGTTSGSAILSCSCILRPSFCKVCVAVRIIDCKVSVKGVCWLGMQKSQP